MVVVSKADPSVIADALQVLGNERRLVALRVLVDRGGCSIRELSDRVAASLNETSVERVDASDRKAVYIALYQHHIPQLVDAGFVERDRYEITAEPWAADVLDAVNGVIDELPAGYEVTA